MPTIFGWMTLRTENCRLHQPNSTKITFLRLHSSCSTRSTRNMKELSARMWEHKKPLARSLWARKHSRLSSQRCRHKERWLEILDRGWKLRKIWSIVQLTHPFHQKNPLNWTHQRSLSTFFLIYRPYFFSFFHFWISLNLLFKEFFSPFSAF